MTRATASAGEGESAASGEITALLEAARRGDRSARDRLFDTVYSELRRIAHARRREWRGDETINTTALVHEAYLKLTHQREVPWRDRGQFYATASRAMRHVLINYARDRSALKRGGKHAPLPLHGLCIAGDDTMEELIALDQALASLADMSERQVGVVECRFFGGLNISQTAEALNVSPATVKRDWAVASAWLRRQLAG